VTDGSTDFALADEFLVAPYESNEIALRINDGATNFAIGDKFTVTVVVGSRECKLVNSGVSDGSQTPYAILAEDIDASLAAKRAASYIAGQFVEGELYFGGTDTIETHRTGLRDIGLITVDSVSA
jgi:hypothetical protein